MRITFTKDVEEKRSWFKTTAADSYEVKYDPPLNINGKVVNGHEGSVFEKVLLTAIDDLARKTPAAVLQTLHPVHVLYLERQAPRFTNEETSADNERLILAFFDLLSSAKPIAVEYDRDLRKRQSDDYRNGFKE